MSEEVKKMEIDYSSQVDELIPKATELASHGKLNEALDLILSLEKHTRSASDAISTGRLLVCIAQLCYKARNWQALNDYLLTMSKKRGQSKQAVTKMVDESCQFASELTDKAEKLRLIETLRTVTAGKIYVEVQRARLTKQLAEIKEADGCIAEAADVLQELQVETFGSMEKCDQVVSGAVSAKIDRLAGVVHFSSAQSSTQLLTDWAHSLDSVMRLVGEVGHLINKERMVHQPA